MDGIIGVVENLSPTLNKLEKIDLYENDFYEIIKDKSVAVLEKYERIVAPHGFCNSISFGYDLERMGRYSAVTRRLNELGRD